MTLTQITEKGIKDGEIINADINASAAIAGSKISPNFGNQNVSTTGNLEIDSDSAELKLGDGQDFRLFHNGTDNKVIAQNGELLVQCNTYSLRNENGSATYATINSSGNLGLGTTSPTHPLDAHTSGTEIARFQGANDARLKLRNSTSNLFLAYTDSGDAFQLGTGGQNPRVHITSGGNVGINTTNPTEQLTLGDGDLKFFHSNAANAHRTTFIEFGNSSNRITSETNYGSDSSSNYTAGLKFTTKNYNGSSFQTINALSLQANGRVGIGTTSPSQKLTVAYNNGSPWSTSSLGVGMKIENTNAVNGVAAGLELRSFQNNGGASIQYIHAVNDGTSSYGSDLVFSTRVAYTGGYRESCRITNAGSLKFPSGHGIDFSSTSQASGSSSELLDDYEEGTWTPALQTSNNNYSGTQSTQDGIYVKVGRSVWVFGRINRGSVTGGSGGVQITGLPFGSNHGGQYESVVTYGYRTGVGYASLTGWVSTSTDRLNLAYNDSNATYGVSVGALSTGNHWIYFSCHYYADS